jgi:hypothetical protein|eukprot:COSAG03_NODE_190_length_10901_cov_14.018330_5_plen_337_part_00
MLRLVVHVGLLRLLLHLLAVDVQPTHGSVSGYHVDDETCSGLLYDNKTTQLPKCAKFFGMLANTSLQLQQLSAELGRPQPLKLTVDAGVGWTCPQQQPCTPPYCGCFNVTFGGATKSVAKHVIDLADETVLMDYKKNAADVYQAAEPFLVYADSHPQEKRIRVGVAVNDPASKTQPFEVSDEAALGALMAAAEPFLRRHRSFAGFAVFASWWYASSLVKPAPASTTWPRGTGVWYLNHSMVLSPDGRDRVAWLQWAKSRGITEIYTAPHAGDGALISTPGRSGSSADDQRFCDFVAEAAKVDYGIEIQLLSAPEADKHWFKNCSAANAPQSTSNGF